MAGRTDAGVHARGQVVTFDAGAAVADLDLEALVRSVNHQCGPAIAVREAEVVPPEFDARFSARSRRYRYLVLNRPHPDPFLAATSWHVERPLDRWAMDLACDPFIGEHDFAAYCRRPKHRDGSVASLVRRVKEATWSDDGDGLLRFEIEASSFCHQMVRSIVGTMVAVGPRTPAGRRRGRDHPQRRPVEGRRPRPAPGPHPVVGRLRRLVQLTDPRRSGDEVDGVAFGAEAVDRDQPVIGVAGLEGEQELDLVDAHRRRRRGGARHRGR